MIVYSKTLGEFRYDIDLGIIGEEILKQLKSKGFNHNNKSEFRSWENSLIYMKNVLDESNFKENLNVAIEYTIPNTSKRVDFLITGLDESDKKNVVIVELKQWNKVERTTKIDLVTTFINKSTQTVTHPSYQAHSYAKTIENYNEYVREEKINLYPCAYLHNYNEEHRKEIDNDFYFDIIQDAPLFLKRDSIKLREFIKRYIKKSDHGKLLYEIDHGRIRPSKSLQDSFVSMLEGNQEFFLIDEQKVAFETIKDLVTKSFNSDKKYTIIIEGGPGTGKSVIAINLLSEFRDKMVNYVTKNSAPRNVFFAKLIGENYKKKYIENLFKGSGSYINSTKNEFDLLVVDEAHRLNRKSGIFQNLGENQIKEIINATKISVFFIDEGQMVTTKDFGTIDEIKKQAKKLDSNLIYGENYKLVSQFRCNGSDGYLSFLDDLLGIRSTANYDGFDLEYDFRIYDDLVKMKNDLYELNKIKNKARILSGYTYDWISKKYPNNSEVFDIVIGDFKAKWNFSNTNTWAIDEDSFEQVGCIHTSQGLEFDYVGVILGEDIYYNNGVKTDFKKRAKTDQSLKGTMKTQDFELTDKIIRNTYKTLMSRGQKGCFVYIEDDKLREYIKNRINKI